MQNARLKTVCHIRGPGGGGGGGGAGAGGLHQDFLKIEFLFVSDEIILFLS